MAVGVPLHTTGNPVETVQHIARKSAENRLQSAENRLKFVSGWANCLTMFDVFQSFKLKSQKFAHGSTVL